MNTLRECINRSHGKAAWELLTDSTTAPLMRKRMGYSVAGSHEIITDMSFEQLMLIMSSARFASSEKECVDVARLIHHLIGRTDVLPLISAHAGLKLASRCLVSLALFRAALVERTRHRASPPPHYYRQVGVKVLATLDMDEVSVHFDNWSCFVGETLGC